MILRGHSLIYSVRDIDRCKSTKSRIYREEIGVSLFSLLPFLCFLTADGRSHGCRRWKLQRRKYPTRKNIRRSRGSGNQRQRGECRPAGVSYKRRMHFLLQRRARCGRRCIGAGEELIRAFLASPFSLPRCHGSPPPPSLPIYLPSVVSFFLCLFFSCRNFLIFKFETFIRIIIVFICQLVISLSLLSLPPPSLSLFVENVAENAQRETNRPDSTTRFYFSLIARHRWRSSPKLRPSQSLHTLD